MWSKERLKGRPLFWVGVRHHRLFHTTTHQHSSTKEQNTKHKDRPMCTPTAHTARSEVSRWNSAVLHFSAVLKLKLLCPAPSSVATAATHARARLCAPSSSLCSTQQSTSKDEQRRNRKGKEQEPTWETDEQTTHGSALHCTAGPKLQSLPSPLHKKYGRQRQRWKGTKKQHKRGWSQPASAKG